MSSWYVLRGLSQVQEDYKWSLAMTRRENELVIGEMEIWSRRA